MTTSLTHEPGWVPADTLATRLMLVRRELGLSQRAMADLCGLGFGEIQSIEDGRQARGLDMKVARIAMATGVSRDWLMWGERPSDGGPGDGERLPRLDSNQQPTGYGPYWDYPPQISNLDRLSLAA